MSKTSAKCNAALDFFIGIINKLHMFCSVFFLQIIIFSQIRYNHISIESYVSTSEIRNKNVDLFFPFSKFLIAATSSEDTFVINNGMPIPICA